MLKLTICLNDVPVDELTQVVHETRVEFYARRLVAKTKEEMPRKQLRIAVHAKIGSRVSVNCYFYSRIIIIDKIYKKVIAREQIKEYSRNFSSLNAKGDKSRKTKLIKEQAEFKKLIRENAKISVNKNLLINILKLNDFIFQNSLNKFLLFFLSCFIYHSP